jgi:hypothetical protein
MLVGGFGATAATILVDVDINESPTTFLACTLTS